MAIELPNRLMELAGTEPESEKPSGPVIVQAMPSVPTVISVPMLKLSVALFSTSFVAISNEPVPVALFPSVGIVAVPSAPLPYAAES